MRKLSNTEAKLYIIKEHDALLTDNQPIKVNWKFNLKIENRNTFKIKTGYYIEFLAPEIIKLFRNTENKITNGK